MPIFDSPVIHTDPLFYVQVLYYINTEIDSLGDIAKILSSGFTLELVLDDSVHTTPISKTDEVSESLSYLPTYQEKATLSLRKSKIQCCR